MKPHLYQKAKIAIVGSNAKIFGLINAKRNDSDKSDATCSHSTPPTKSASLLK
jgi:hypothetical protein